MNLPPYIYGREAGPNEEVWTEAAVREAVAAKDIESSKSEALMRGRMDSLETEIARLRLQRDDAVAADREQWAEYLKEGQTPFERFQQERKDLDALMGLYQKAVAAAVPKMSTGWVAPKDQYAVPVLFNPYTGEPRDVRDVQSDPQGILIQPSGNVAMIAAAPEVKP